MKTRSTEPAGSRMSSAPDLITRSSSPCQDGTPAGAPQPLRVSTDHASRFRQHSLKGAPTVQSLKLKVAGGDPGDTHGQPGREHPAQAIEACQTRFRWRPGLVSMRLTWGSGLVGSITVWHRDGSSSKARMQCTSKRSLRWRPRALQTGDVVRVRVRARVWVWVWMRARARVIGDR